MKMISSFATSIILASTIATAAQATGPVYATYAGSQLGITDRDTALVQQNAFSTGLVASGITVTTSNRIYTSAQNNLLEYSVGGALVNQMTFPDAAIDYTAIDTAGDQVFATYKGSQQGVTLRTSALVQTSSFGTGVDATGIAVAPGNAIYITAANSIYHYDFSGALQNTMTFPDDGILYTDIDFGYGMLFASYAGSQLGFTVRDLALNQLAFYGVDFAISGLAVGNNNNLFLTSANNLYEYSTAGVLLNSFTFPDDGIDYTAIDVRAVPEPSSWAMLIAGFGLVGGAIRRRGAQATAVRA